MAEGQLTNTEILTPSRTEVFLAPVGTAAPTALDTILPIWINVGFTTADSLTFETTPTWEDVNAAQSDYPVKQVQTADGAAFQVDLQQWNRKNFQTVYGGGTFEEIGTGTGIYKFTPPAIGEVAETAALIRVREGSKTIIWVVPKCQQTEGVSTALNKGATSTLPLRLKVLGSDGVAPWYILSNLESMAPAAG